MLKNFFISIFFIIFVLSNKIEIYTMKNIIYHLSKAISFITILIGFYIFFTQGHTQTLNNIALISIFFGVITYILTPHKYDKYDINNNKPHTNHQDNQQDNINNS